MIGTVVNHIVEGFVKAVAGELPRGVRINCISPTVLTEAVAYHPYFQASSLLMPRKSGKLIYARFRTRSPGAFLTLLTQPTQPKRVLQPTYESVERQ